jgi:hypothetical protein
MPGKTFIQINKPSTKQDSVLCWAFDYDGLFHFSRPGARCHGHGCCSYRALTGCESGNGSHRGAGYQGGLGYLVAMAMPGCLYGALTGCKSGNGS